MPPVCLEAVSEVQERQKCNETSVTKHEAAVVTSRKADISVGCPGSVPAAPVFAFIPLLSLRSRGFLPSTSLIPFHHYLIV